MKTIAIATLNEAVRKKTFVVMGVVTVLYLVLWAVLLYFFRQSMAQDSDLPLASVMVSQLGLQFSSMLICLLTIILGAGAIASELETGMIHAVLSRPLGRGAYVLGKLLGLGILVVIYATVLFGLLLLIGRVFSLGTVMSMQPLQILKGWLVYTLVPLCVLCLTLYGSVTMKVVPNGLLMIFIFVLGNIGGVVEMIGNYLGSRAVISTGIFISLVSPFHTLYGVSERLLLSSAGLRGDLLRSLGGLSGTGLPVSPAMYVYTALYAFGFLALAVRRFKKTDIH
jgi:ABC-type transport system involved in multi-copper enzyme maturation permease subunit